MSSDLHGNFVWYELLTTEPLDSLGFYQQVLEWSHQTSEQTGAHSLFAAQQGPLASVDELPVAARAMGAGPFWNAVVEVDNADEIVARVRRLGGRVYHEATNYSGAGRVAVVADPFGAALSVLSRDASRSSHDRSKPGEVCWHELISENQEVAFAFWNGLFGWKKLGEHDMGLIGKYLLFGFEGRPMGGIFQKPKEVPASAWLYYFQVSNVDEAIERATGQGGKLQSGPMAVPSGARVAQLSDPQGAVFAIHQNPRP